MATNQVPQGCTDDIKAAFSYNAKAILAHEGTWALGVPFCALWVVVPVYLLYLGVSKTLLQTITVIIPALTFLQLWSSGFFSGSNRKWKLYRTWFVFGICWIVYGLSATIFWPALPQWVWISLFACTITVIAVVMNLGGPAFAGLIIENIPKRRRGMLTTLRLTTFGVFGIAGFFPAKWLMETLDTPFNFHIRFIIGGAIFSLSCLFILCYRDNAATTVAYHNEEPSRIKSLRTLFSDFNFRVFLLFYAILVGATSLIPLLIGYGKDILLLSQAQQEYFVLALFAGMIIVGLTVPLLADRFGFRLVAIMAALLLAGAFLTPFVLPPGKVSLFAAYAVAYGCFFLLMHILANLGAEIVPEVRPSTIIAVGNTLAVPLSLVIAPIGGLLVDIYGENGYIAAFVMGITLCLCALLGFMLLTREPRTGQQIYIRIRKF